MDNVSDEKEMPAVVLILIWLLVGLGLPALFFACRLVVEVRPDGIYYRYYPFHRSFHTVEPTEQRTLSGL